jgi:hypothetical protein
MEETPKNTALCKVLGIEPRITPEQMLQEGTLHGMLEESTADKAIEQLTNSLEEASQIIESIKKCWQIHQPDSSLNTFNQWLQLYGQKIKSASNEALAIEEPEGGWEKVKSFFGILSKEQKEKTENAAEHVLVAEALRLALVALHERLIKITKDEPRATPDAIKAFAEKQLKSVQQKLSVSEVELDKHVSDAMLAAISDELGQAVAKSDRTKLDAALSELESNGIEAAPEVVALAAGAAAPAASPTPAGRGAAPADGGRRAARGSRSGTASAAALAAAPGGTEPAAGAAGATEPVKIKRSNLEKIIKSFVDKNGPIPLTTHPNYADKVDALLNRVRDSLGSKGVKMESRTINEAKLICERLNRLAGLPTEGE